MRRLCTLLIAAMLPMLAFAGEAIDSSKLIGSWKSPSTDFQVKMTFNKDGTYDASMKAGDKEMTDSGTWKLEGDKLSQTCTKCSVEGRVGKSHTVTVTALTDEKFTVRDGPGKEDEIALVRDRK